MGIERPKGTECSCRQVQVTTTTKKSSAYALWKKYQMERKTQATPRARAFHFSHSFSCIRPPLPPPSLRLVPPAWRSHCNWTWKFRRSCWFDTLSYSHSIKFAEDGAAESAAIGGFYLELGEKCEKIPGARPAEMRMRSILGTLSRRSARNSLRNVFTTDSRSDFTRLNRVLRFQPVNRCLYLRAVRLRIIVHFDSQYYTSIMR
jgi:hypothetical protein